MGIVNGTALECNKNFRVSFDGDNLSSDGGLLLLILFCRSIKMIKYVCNIEKFTKIPGGPIAYWVSDAFSQRFSNKRISDYAEPRHGMSTRNNDLCLKLWHEISNADICFDAESKEDFDDKRGKYAPYKKGGEFRLWYGNDDYVIAYLSEARKRMEALSG